MFWKKKEPYRPFACKCGCTEFALVMQIDARDFTIYGRMPMCIRCGTIYGEKGEVLKEGRIGQ